MSRRWKLVLRLALVLVVLIVLTAALASCGGDSSAL
jgi:hypothetical protein